MARAPITIEIDPRSLRQFDKTLRQYAGVSKKTNAEVINRTALNLGFWAAYFCKKGPNTTQRVEAAMNYPFKILHWVNTQKGRPQPRLKERNHALRALLIARANAAGHIARGWAEAAREIQKRSGVKGGRVRLGKGMGRKGNGAGKMAKEAIRVFSMLINYATTSSRTSFQALKTFGQEAMDKAMTYKQRDMLVYIRRKLDQNVKQFNSKR